MRLPIVVPSSESKTGLITSRSEVSGLRSLTMSRAHCSPFLRISLMMRL